jgi:toxin ParE2
MKWRIEPAARLELVDAASWYDAAKLGLGADFLDEFEAGLRRIEELPNAWHALGDQLRRYRLKRFPYGIIYHVGEGEIVVIAVAHLHREPGYWYARLKKP